MKTFILKNKKTGKTITTDEPLNQYKAVQIWKKLNKAYPGEYIIEEQKEKE